MVTIPAPPSDWRYDDSEGRIEFTSSGIRYYNDTPPKRTKTERLDALERDVAKLGDTLAELRESVERGWVLGAERHLAVLSILEQMNQTKRDLRAAIAEARK
jgi:uncharacterized coiled-coil protein SlyX